MDEKEKFDAKVKVSKFLSESSVLYIRDAISKELDKDTFDSANDLYKVFAIITASIILSPIDQERSKKQRSNYINFMMSQINNIIKINEEAKNNKN
jgi:hypothetical protein